MSIDENMLRSVLEQNFSTVKGFIEMMFKDVKQDVRELREENEELRKSLTFSQRQIDELRKDVRDLKSSENNSTLVMNKLSDASERVRVLEDTSRNKNIRITGICEFNNENAEQTQVKVCKLISENLRLENITVTDAYRVGKHTPQLSRGPRPIIAKLTSVNDKISCFKTSNRLKGTDIFISDDVSKATLDIRRQKLDILKQKRQEGFIAYFSGTEIITKRRPNATYNASTSSASNGSPNAGGPAPIHVLSVSSGNSASSGSATSGNRATSGNNATSGNSASNSQTKKSLRNRGNKN